MFDQPQGKQANPYRHDIKRIWNQQTQGKIIVYRTGAVRIFPGWCNQVYLDVTRQEAAQQIRAARKAGHALSTKWGM